jgi:hypothetical protein
MQGIVSYHRESEDFIMRHFCDVSKKHKELSKIIRKKDRFADAINLFLEIHSALHLSAVSDTAENEVDSLFSDLSPHEYAIMPTPPKKGETIAWAVWHISRIEDMTMNILIAESEQIFDKEWQKRINSSFLDTGVSMSVEEIIMLSREINVSELLAYRNTVGKQTRDIVRKLTADDMKRKVSLQGIEKIRHEGGTTPNCEWLLEYWGKKDVAGILLMPPTRHLIFHLNDCCKWKLQNRSVK